MGKLKEMWENLTSWCLAHPVAFVLCLFSVAAAVYAPDVFAWTAPQQGALAYDIYDIAINSIIKGPIGFVAGAGFLGFGAYMLGTGKGVFPGIGSILAGVALIKADSIVKTLGWIV